MDGDVTCPVPASGYPQVLMAHGGGGRLMHTLLERVLLPAFGNPVLLARHDGAMLEVGDARLAFTTDTYVVTPLFFPGGDIGCLAVNGTVNDLAMCGATPLFLSVGLVLEEGLPMETLQRVVQSVRSATEAAGVSIVTGDTKVVERPAGREPGLFINTAGIGQLREGVEIAPARVRPGDCILLNGDLGRHGMAVMAARDGFALEPPIESDTAPLAGAVAALLDAGVEIHCLRDLTRGGLASALVEIAGASRTGIEIEESALPVRPDVRAACEILGLDPVYVACEGRFAAFVAAADAGKALRALRERPEGEGASLIGTVVDDHAGEVTLRTVFGVERALDMLSGEQLPRIC